MKQKPLISTIAHLVILSLFAITVHAGDVTMTSDDGDAVFSSDKLTVVIHPGKTVTLTAKCTNGTVSVTYTPSSGVSQTSNSGAGSTQQTTAFSFSSGASGQDNTIQASITHNATSNNGQPCLPNGKNLTFHVIVPKVEVTNYTLCNGKSAVTLNLLPVSSMTNSGSLSLKLVDDGSNETQVVAKGSQNGQSGLKPDIDFTKFPTALTNWTTIRCRWTIQSKNFDSTDYSASFKSKQMNCTGYYTACNTAFSGGGGTFWVGSTQYSCNQSFLDAIVRVNGGAVEVLEGVGVLTAGAATYFHFNAGDQQMNAAHTQIIKYVATTNDHDGDCGGTGYALQAGVSVAKKNSSAYFDCGSTMYIAGSDGTVNGLCHKVQDSGHAIDSPDIFQGQGGSRLNTGPGNSIVCWQ